MYTGMKQDARNVSMKMRWHMSPAEIVNPGPTREFGSILIRAENNLNPIFLFNDL